MQLLIVGLPFPAVIVQTIKGGTMTTATMSGEQKSRKERRKEERQVKKRKRSGGGSSSHVPSGQDSKTDTTATTTALNPTRTRAGATLGTGHTTTTQKKPLQKQKSNHPPFTQTKRRNDPDPPNGARRAAASADPYAHLDSTTAAALRRDDQEIAALEAQLLERRGSSGQSSKSRLHREYAKLEGYGDDFGDFLDDLDQLVRHVVVNNKGGDDSTEPYSTLLRSNDSSEDDGEILMKLDDDDDSDLDEEVVPMKGPAWDSLDDDDSVLDELEAQDVELNENKFKETLVSSKDILDNNEREEVDSDDSSTGGDDSGSDAEQEADHDQSVTYRPTQGEDIYGNKLEEMGTTVQPKKYVPPHLRNRDKQIERSDLTQNNNHNNEESMRNITRSLNSALNRLSEDSLIPVAQSLAELYETHPTADVNACLWQNLHNACIDRGHAVMTGLIPVYMAALVGTHLVRGDTAQLGESLMERVVTALWQELDAARAREDDDPTSDLVDDISLVSKQACNQVLILCYLYNFGVVHCSLLYDIIRNMIESFREIDIELLLLILSHCGRTLRSDDPSALKEIVMLVQKTHLEKSSSVSNNKTASSRSEYMVSALQDLKNNKRRKQDQALVDKTTKLRKSLGHIKSNLATSKNGPVRASDSSLRISLQDILDVDTKGRWWKVGASWVGKQHSNDNKTNKGEDSTRGTDDDPVDEKLLKLAAKYRMNTDVRRSIFCIIMGSADYEDCFEKLVRASLLKNRSEREAVRVLMECCGRETTYNQFYAHLAQRICEYQVQCKFTFQLAFWDSFKQFDEMNPRKAANLAKLLFHLVTVAHCLKLNVLKAIDLAAPEDLAESAMIFTTVLLSNILNHYDDPGDVYRLFDGGDANRQSKGNAEDESMDESEALQASLTVFLMQVMKASPQYKKGSKYRRNLKAAIKACDTKEMFS